MNVYDFDDTIYDGESCLDFFRFYLKKQPKLAKFLPRVLWAFAKYKMGKVTVEDAMREYAPYVEDFFAGIPDFDADNREFWDTHMHKIKPFYALQQQPDDVIVTASPEASIQEICRRLHIQHCVGSLIDMNTGKITRLCMRSHKAPAFREAFPDAEIENFYTDSAKNDKTLIDMSKHAFIVKGDKITQIK